MANPAFKPYGKAPPFDLDEYKDSFELWHKKWTIFLSLSTIDSALDAAHRDLYKAHTLLSCLSTDTLQAVLSMGLTDAQLDDHTVIIDHLRSRCNAGRNRHVWRQQFAAKKQGVQQAADDWLCELRDLARRCEFATDCCANCEPTRILGQLIFGVESDDVRVKLLEQGATLSLDRALTIIRTAEASNKQSKNLKTGDAAAIQGATSSYKRFKQKSSKPPAGGSSSAGATFAGCWNCGSETRCKPLTACPAQGKDCRKCGLLNHYSKVCRNPKAATKTQQGIYIDPSPPTVGAVNTSDLVELAIRPEKWTSSFMINFLPDTGADLDAIPESLYKRMFSKVALQKGVQPVTAVGSPIVSIGVFSAVIVWTTRDRVSRSVNTAIHVLRELKQPVLSKRSQQTLGMLPPAYPHTYVGMVTNTPPTDSKQQAECFVITNVRKCIIRPTFEMDTPFQTVRTIPPGMRFSTFIVALKRFLQVPLDDTSVILAFVLLHNQVVFANPAVTFGGDVVNAGKFQLDPELIRATYEFHHPAQSLTSVHYLLVSVFHVLFGQALHQQAVGHPSSCHGSSSTRLPHLNSSWADFYWHERRFFFAHVPAFPTPSTTPATTPAQPEIFQPPPPVQENPVPLVQENPAPPVTRRSTRRRQPRRHFFPTEWTQ